MRTVLYPGSFDPVTNGHIDVARRAAKIFDRVVIAVAVNAEKNPLFTTEERIDLIRSACHDIPNLEVSRFSGLLAHSLELFDASAVIRGLRAVSDFEYEFQMALANRKMNHRLDTVFLMTSDRYMYLSSSLVREIGRHGGDISDFVPLKIQKRVLEKLSK